MDSHHHLQQQQPPQQTLMDPSSSSSSSSWKPKIESLEERRRLRGLQHNNELIGSIGFHHIEFYCGDARSTANQFAIGLGMSITGTTSQATGNDQCVSYGLESDDNFRLLLTAPYSKAVVQNGVSSSSSKNEDNAAVEYDAPTPLPNFNVDSAHDFFQKHGLAARAVGIEVIDAKAAFEASVANGAIPVTEPTFVANMSRTTKK